VAPCGQFHADAPGRLFLKGGDTGWDEQSPVQLNVRHVDGSFELRAEHEWPLARTRWTRLYLDLPGGGLTAEPPAGDANAASRRSATA
jgi:uncharacterized protein